MTVSTVAAGTGTPPTKNDGGTGLPSPSNPPKSNPNAVNSEPVMPAVGKRWNASSKRGSASVRFSLTFFGSGLSFVVIFTDEPAS